MDAPNGDAGSRPAVLSEAERAEIAARWDAVTSGRWRVVLGGGMNLCTGVAAEQPDGRGIAVADCLPGWASNAALPSDHRPNMAAIAAAPSDVARLLASHDALTARVAELKSALTALLHEVDESGNGDATNHGWPAALSASRAALTTTTEPR